MIAFQRIDDPLFRGGIKGGGRVLGLPLVEDPCSAAKGRRAGSHREADGRLMRVAIIFWTRTRGMGIRNII